MLVDAQIITEEQFDIALFTGLFNYYIEDNVFADLQHRGWHTLMTFTPERRRRGIQAFLRCLNGAL